MDISDWNECLFDALVRDVGASGDPLYLYVDDEVLASASGARSPDEAVEDFRQAFRATSFADARRRADRWKRGGYDGVPPHVAALAMTVLGVTLPSLGRAKHNVYSRQRDLLGLDDLDGGVPGGYGEHVPALWRNWNEWLEGAGAMYGTATATSDQHFTLQGWARSQSFIRARDKQDIYAFFESQGGRLDRATSGTDLVTSLALWLRGQGSISRLLRAAENPEYQDELGHCLAAALDYWNGTIEARAVPARLKALPHWSPETRVFNLIVKVRDQRGATGVEVVDLALHPWTVGPQDQFMYLSPEGMPASQWARNPIRAWRFGPVWIVDWEPPASGIWAFEEWRRGDWIMAERVRPDGVYRVLVTRARADLPSNHALVEAPGVGFWVQLDGSPLIRGREIAALLGDGSKRTRTLSLGLRGGLRVDSTGIYLVGGEPDIEIDGGIDLNGVLVAFDGEPLAPEDLDTCGNGLRLRVQRMYPSSGEHRLLVISGEEKKSARFFTRDPALRLGNVPQCPAPGGSLLSPMLPWHPGTSAMLLLSPDGGAWSATARASVAPWLAQVVKGANFELDRTIDLNDLVGLDGSVTVVAARKTRTGAWRVGTVPGSPEATAKAAGLVIRQLDMTSGVLIDFLFSSPEPTAISPQAESNLAQFRAALGKSTAGSGRLPTVLRLADASPTADARGSDRTDIQPGPVATNPLDDFLYWLSEREGGVSTHTAAETLDWLYERHEIPGPPDFRQTVRSLGTLGYIRVDTERGRLVVEPTMLSLLPAAEGLSLLVGARSEDLVAELRSPSDDHPEGRAAALQDLIAYETVQTQKDTPLAPTTTYIRLGADDPGRQAAALGIEFLAHRSTDLLNSVTPIIDYVQDETRAFRLTGIVRFDEFLPFDMAPGGRWRALTTLPPKDGFLRARSPNGDRYLWWNHDAARLIDCGWIAGLWAFNARITHRLLVDHVDASNQLLVSNWALLPPSIERAVVARSGLLPRLGWVPGRRDEIWRVYENVPGRVAVRVRGLLGQTAKMRRPVKMEYR